MLNKGKKRGEREVAKKTKEDQKLEKKKSKMKNRKIIKNRLKEMQGKEKIEQW